MSFVHLHVHTHYSIMDAISQIRPLFKRAEELGMPALAITDHGNMYGVKEFYDEARKHPDIKPILGCEVNITDHYDHRLKDVEHKKYFHLVLLAKNYKGYKNLMKIVSIGHTEGMYYGKPRISHEVIKNYSEGLICLSGCPGGEIPQAILADNLNAADKATKWYKDVFGDVFYLEVTCHKSKISEDLLSFYHAQAKANEAIYDLADKHDIKVVASNDVHFVRREEDMAHDVFTCIYTGKQLKDKDRCRYTGQEYLKSEEEMMSLFYDHPEVISNTLEVAEKVDRFSIEKMAECNHVNIDDIFGYSTYGAEQKYGEVSYTLEKKLYEECRLIIDKGWEKYFLMMSELTSWCREHGIRLGPGRGAAAGSRVNYCLGITDLDPDTYGLMPCRFMDSEQSHFPLIDLDIESSSREKVIRHITVKYGSDHVAHVINFGYFSPRNIVDRVGTVMGLSKAKIKILTTLVSGKYCEMPWGGIARQLIEDPILRNEFESNPGPVRDTLLYASQLQGCIYTTGINPCALIISDDELTDYVPVTIQKDITSGEDIIVSQYDSRRVDDTGIVRMNLLNLSTLSVIDNTIKEIRSNHGIEINLNNIPLDDNLVYDLFSRGDTEDIFIYDGDGMRRWLKELKPDCFNDLVALNAMYRPGPMDYLSDFCAHKRKHYAIKYPIAAMEDILGETYGVIVYQEQVMKLSQVISGFSKSESNRLRKCIGKLRREELEQLKEKFIEGGVHNGYLKLAMQSTGLNNGYSRSSLQKVWEEMTNFGMYAFNKAHAACYTMIAYQCAWLKAHYPHEYKSVYKEVYGG